MNTRMVVIGAGVCAVLGGLSLGVYMWSGGYDAASETPAYKAAMSVPEIVPQDLSTKVYPKAALDKGCVVNCKQDCAGDSDCAAECTDICRVQ